MTLRLLSLFLSPIKAMTALLDRIVGVIAGFQSREANLRQQLADALSDDAADEAAIAAAQRDALAAMERAATAEALMAQLQASAQDSDTQLQAIGAYIDQFVPALTDTESPALPGGDTAAESAETEVVAGDNSGADDEHSIAADHDGADETEVSDVESDSAPDPAAPEADTGFDQPAAA